MCDAGLVGRMAHRATQEMTMAKTQSEAQWQEIDVDTLSDGLRTAYEVYKEAAREAAKLRTEFEAQMNAELAEALPQGTKCVFGYRFGKLSMAVVKDEAKPKAQGKQSLGDYLKGMQSAGRRC